MSSFENFVQCRVVTPFTAAATEIGLFAADEPHRLPAEGGGVLVLTDSPYRPSVLEVIRYGRRSGMALYEVSRAQEGTTARDWTGVAFCYQALTAGELAQLLGQKADLSALDELREDAETALDTKVDKIAGKGLSTNDYTTAEKNKLAHANLTALVGLTGAADRLPYFTGAGALSLATLTAAARTLLAASNVAEQRSALGLGTAATRDIGQSGAAIPLLNQINTWSNPQYISGQASHPVPLFLERATSVNVSMAFRLNGTGEYTHIGMGPNTPGELYIGATADLQGKGNKVHHDGNQLSLGTTAASARTAMGLGTAATRNVQTGIFDTTANALMAVGAFGLGQTATSISSASLDDYEQPTGIYSYRVDVGGGTFPGNIADVQVLHRRTSFTATQLAMATFGSRVFYRRHYDGTWYPWVELFHTGNTSALPITNSLSPASDNSVTLGEANKRWSTAHLGTAPIVTSDREAKQDILPIDDAVLDAWATLGYMQYRLKDAVAAKGEAARTHAGLIAQDIREAFEAAGLDPFKYGVLCYDEWDQELREHPAEYEWNTVPAVLDDEGNEVEPERQEQGELIKEAWTEVVREAGHRYSVRYEEAFALECALQRRTTQRLEQRLAALEAA